MTAVNTITRHNYRDLMMAKHTRKGHASAKKDKTEDRIVRVTAIRVDTDWKELDHVAFTTKRGGKWTLDDLALAARKDKGEGWVLGHGDIIHITEEVL